MNDTIAKILVELNLLFEAHLSQQAIAERYNNISDKYLQPLAIKIKVRHAKD